MSANNSCVSIIIPSYNGLNLLKNNIPIILERAKEAKIIVVDDASTDGTEAYLNTHFPQVKVIRNQENIRFAASVNKAVTFVEGGLVYLLNNDVVPKGDFLDKLLPYFNDSNVFAVASREIEGNKQSGRNYAWWQRGLIVHSLHKDIVRGETLWVSGGSGLFSVELWRSLGGFSVDFYPAYDEDRDLAYRALKRGYRLYFEPESVVLHNHETTNSKVFNRYYLEIAKHKNALILIWRNITTKKLWLSHICWLPYHLLVTNLKTKGAFGWGVLWAVFKFVKILNFRADESKYAKVRDEQILVKSK